MNKLTLATLFLFGSCHLILAGVDPAAQQLLTTVEQQANLFQHDASPFQMDIDFLVQMELPTRGHLTLKWEADNRWWRKVSMAGFLEVDIRNDDTLYTIRNLPFTPLRVRDLLTCSPLPSTPRS